MVVVEPNGSELTVSLNLLNFWLLTWYLASEKIDSAQVFSCYLHQNHIRPCIAVCLIRQLILIGSTACKSLMLWLMLVCICSVFQYNLINCSNLEEKCLVLGHVRINLFPRRYLNSPEPLATKIMHPVPARKNMTCIIALTHTGDMCAFSLSTWEPRVQPFSANRLLLSRHSPRAIIVLSR